jgi:3-dehydroquinate synthetase
LLAFGGGLVTDFAGFAASIFMRGIRYVSLPTTVLGMCDAAIGGKTAVNHASYGKNLIGSFYEPHEVIVNVDFLKTLD